MVDVPVVRPSPGRRGPRETSDDVPSACLSDAARVPRDARGRPRTGCVSRRPRPGSVRRPKFRSWACPPKMLLSERAWELTRVSSADHMRATSFAGLIQVWSLLRLLVFSILCVRIRLLPIHHLLGKRNPKFRSTIPCLIILFTQKISSGSRPLVIATSISGAHARVHREHPGNI